MLAFRRFNNRLVQGTQTSSKTGSPVVYELKEQKPVYLKIPREISGYLLLAPGANKVVPLPFGYDSETEKLYCIFRISGIAGFSIVASDGVSNTLVKGTSTQVGRYSFSDIIESIAVFNPSSTDSASMQYTMFVIPDLSDDNNYYGLVSPIVTPGDSGGGGDIVATPCCQRIYAGSGRLDYSSTPVTTGAWTTVIPAVSYATTRLEIFDSSGETLELGVGTAGSESRIMIIPPGGQGIDVVVAQGDRLAVRAITATAAVGEIDITAFS